MKTERYRLILRHELVDGDAVTPLDLPVMAEYCVVYGQRKEDKGALILINDMLAKLTHYILTQVKDNE